MTSATAPFPPSRRDNTARIELAVLIDRKANELILLADRDHLAREEAVLLVPREDDLLVHVERRGRRRIAELSADTEVSIVPAVAGGC